MTLLSYEMSRFLIDPNSIFFISHSISIKIITLFIHTHSLISLIIRISFHLFIISILIIKLDLKVYLFSSIQFEAKLSFIAVKSLIYDDYRLLIQTQIFILIIVYFLLFTKVVRSSFILLH